MRLYILTMTMVFLPSIAHADWVMLSNGDRISGEITNQNSDNLTIDNAALGQITISKAKIASIHAGTAPRTTARDLRLGTVAQAAPVAIAPTPAPAPAPAPAKTNKKDERQEGVYKWSGRASVGGNIEDGNSSSKSVTADIDIKTRDKNNRIAFGGEANWAEEDGEKTDNDQQIYASYDRFITDKWFIGGRQSFEKDEFEELDLRSQTGLFAGYQFYEQDDLNLQIKTGPEYIYEKFDNGDSESDIAAAWALDYDQKLFDEAVQAFHKHEIGVPFADTGAFLLESETGIRMPIGKRLDASLQVDFDWDNDPAQGLKENDTTYALKLGYGW